MAEFIVISTTQPEDKKRFMYIFALANQKGGVGKTTTAVTLASGFAQNNKNTLLVDLDPQGHVAFSFGLDKQAGLYRWVVMEEALK